MRSLVFASLAVLGGLAPAHAIPVTWEAQATVTRTHLPALGLATGDELSISMTLESATPGIPTHHFNGYVYQNVFDAFTLSVNGHTLALGPASGVPGFPWNPNSLATTNFPEYHSVQWNTLMFDGDTPYFAETWFEFTDPNAFPTGSLPLTPPSLESARLAQISLYSPAEGGGLIFIARADVDSLTSRSVPEPASGLLLLAGLGMMAMWRKREART